MEKNVTDFKTATQLGQKKIHYNTKIDMTHKIIIYNMNYIICVGEIVVMCLIDPINKNWAIVPDEALFQSIGNKIETLKLKW